MSKRGFKWLPEFITRHVLIALVIGGLAGVGFMVFLMEFDHYTSTEQFCTTCHSMTLVAEPYRQSAHYLPTSGVRASCGDCHVSPGIFAATWDHFIGGKDVIRQLFGENYDDPVINALHLPEAAFSAREWFRKRDSATCKRCHVQDASIGKRADTQRGHGREDVRRLSHQYCSRTGPRTGHVQAGRVESDGRRKIRLGTRNRGEATCRVRLDSASTANEDCDEAARTRL